jgi:phosphohistidine phosphatase
MYSEYCYILRHAEAADHPIDRDRELTERGKAQADSIGRQLASGGLPAPALIWHSSLVRARQTAERVAACLPEPSAQLLRVPGLRPHEDPDATRARISEEADFPVLVVGHNPHLGLLLARLLVNDARPTQSLRVPKASLWVLEEKRGSWRLETVLQADSA